MKHREGIVRGPQLTIITKCAHRWLEMKVPVFVSFLVRFPKLCVTSDPWSPHWMTKSLLSGTGSKEGGMLQHILLDRDGTEAREMPLLKDDSPCPHAAVNAHHL